ncbi:glycosyltransferase [Chitinispirillales bacterium ANBcel5]|uniref:glycosyltransferase n=1 Tax=Cellulosispirillum alkaliphilum TaxID=3039283 RepID=UPI002A5202E5|nr:glycosyltransferase [Chitinispirillales bacterium ANBcel5]
MNKEDNVYLSIVIPAFNEAGAIRAGKLNRIVTWVEEQAFSSEIVVVDDGSLDETASLAALSADRVLRIEHAGKATALVSGISQARGEKILFTDMDQATPIKEASKLLDALKTVDVAIGSRGLVRPGAPLGRYLLSWGQVVLRTLILGLKFSDTQCGFKAMSSGACKDIVSKLYLYRTNRRKKLHGPSVTSGFDVEFLYVAKKLGYSVAEIGVEWNYQETRRVNLFRDSLRGIRDLIYIKMAALTAKYSRRS